MRRTRRQLTKRRIAAITIPWMAKKPPQQRITTAMKRIVKRETMVISTHVFDSFMAFRFSVLFCPIFPPPGVK
jgi:hypothetical protein